jgi:NAD(P)-dependent dehydrogenase (short-subunit alcohol dehydrogenase family)
VKAAIAEAEKRSGGALDVVDNNAGYALGGALEDVEIPDVAKVFDTNLYGALRVMQAALPAMRARG